MTEGRDLQSGDYNEEETDITNWHDRQVRDMLLNDCEKEKIDHVTQRQRYPGMETLYLVNCDCPTIKHDLDSLEDKNRGQCHYVLGGDYCIRRGSDMHTSQIYRYRLLCEWDEAAQDFTARTDYVDEDKDKFNVGTAL